MIKPHLTAFRSREESYTQMTPLRRATTRLESLFAKATEIGLVLSVMDTFGWKTPGGPLKAARSSAKGESMTAVVGELVKEQILGEGCTEITDCRLSQQQTTQEYWRSRIILWGRSIGGYARKVDLNAGSRGSPL